VSKSIAIAVIFGLAALVTADQAVLAQAGSIGGIIGKTDKSVSGGEEQQKPGDQSEKAKAGNDLRRRASHELTTGPSIDGRWQYEQSCFSGNATFRLDIHQSGGRFTGKVSGHSDVGGASSGEISDGQIQGNRATFTINCNDSYGGIVRQVAATFSPSNGRVTQMEGSFFGRVAKCTFTASRN
jgi:hypothetical protein